MEPIALPLYIDLLRRALNILLIVGGSILLIWVITYLVKRVIKIRFRSKTSIEVQRRIRTAIPLTNSVIKYTVAFFVLIAVLREIGVDATALLAGAGVVGIAIGFGAQTLVKDILTGMFLLFEDSVSIGDIIQIGDITGRVEDVGLRVTHIRPFSGALITIPNGEISRIANFNRGFTRAIIEVGVAYEVDVDRAVEVLQEVAEKYKEGNKDKVMEFIGIHRIARLDASSVVLRLVFQVAPLEHWGVERDMLYLIKKTFDKNGIEIPYQKHVVYMKPEAS